MRHLARTPLSRLFEVAVFAAACVLASLLAAPAAHAADNPYGELCGMYESGNDPYEVDDSSPYGGDVFGAYQISTGNAVGYASWLQATYKASKPSYAAWGKTLSDAYGKDGGKGTANFTKAWKSVFPNKKAAYLHTQYLYVKSVYYTPAVAQWQARVPGFSENSYSYALRNVIFSTALQHGVAGSAAIFGLAVASAGGFSAGMSEAALIDAVYAERARVEDYAALRARVLASNPKASVYEITAKGSASAAKYGLLGKSLAHFYSNPANVQVGVYIRLAVNERQSAMTLFARYAGCTHETVKGGTVTKRWAYTDKNHKEKVSKKTCAVCGKVLAKARTRKVKNKFVQSGAKWADAGGRSFTIHRKGWYIAKRKSVLRSGKSQSSGAVGEVGKGKALKAVKSKMGADGFWWCKVKAGKATGWVRARRLRPAATASAVHRHKHGACVYCGQS